MIGNTKDKFDVKETEGKVALVTGASKGIGAAIAKALATTEGAAIVVNYATSKAGADTVVAEITAKGGRRRGGASGRLEADRRRQTVRRDENGVRDVTTFWSTTLASMNSCLSKK